MRWLVGKERKKMRSFDPGEKKKRKVSWTEENSKNEFKIKVQLKKKKISTRKKLEIGE